MLLKNLKLNLNAKPKKIEESVTESVKMNAQLEGNTEEKEQVASEVTSPNSKEQA